MGGVRSFTFSFSGFMTNYTVHSRCYGMKGIILSLFLIFFRFFLHAQTPSPPSVDVLTTATLQTTGASYRSVQTTSAMVQSDGLVEKILREQPDLFAPVLDNPDKYHVQILYTEINRNTKGFPLFTKHSYRLDPKEYFYPASTVKFPAALLALEKMNDLIKTRRITGWDKDTPVRIDSVAPGQKRSDRDLSSHDSLPSLAHWIKKVLLVSDNDAYNRLYEFLGQDYLNTQLQKKGFKDIKITRRLSIGTTPDQDKSTNPMVFYIKNGPWVYRQDATTATNSYSLELNGLRQGLGYVRKDSVIYEPMNFERSNYVSIETLQEILKTVMFPDAVLAQQRFNLSREDYNFLYTSMAMLPKESEFPRYDSTYFDGFVKFFMFGNTTATIPGNFRVFNKVGNAYGYLIDNAYIVNFDTNIEFLLTAVICVNEDGIFNDDKYEYEQIGMPFMANLGRAIYTYESQRPRKVKPNLKPLQALFQNLKPPPPLPTPVKKSTPETKMTTPVQKKN